MCCCGQRFFCFYGIGLIFECKSKRKPCVFGERGSKEIKRERERKKKKKTETMVGFYINIQRVLDMKFSVGREKER